MKVNLAYQKYHDNPSPENYEQLGIALYKYIKAIIATKFGRHFDALVEATGEAALEVYKDLPNFDLSKGNFSTWVYTVTYNTCLDMRRSHLQRKEQILPDWDGDVSLKPKYIGRLFLESLVAKLSIEEQRLVKYKIEGYENEDIAQELNLAVQTVKNKWGLVQHKLRTQRGGN